MPYRNKAYVCFDADTDIRYYWLMRAWKQSDNTSFDFHDAHDLNNLLSSSTEATIKAKLQERIRNTKVFVVLVGEKTKFLYKYVRWEIDQALSRDMPIVAVNLNGRRSLDSARCPPLLKDRLVMHVSFNAAILQHALENWGRQHAELVQEGTSGPYYYRDSVYQGLGVRA